MKEFIVQLNLAMQRLKNSLSFSFIVVITMGVTVGALLCVTTLASLLIFEPLPYPDQGRLFKVEHHIIKPNGETRSTSFNHPGLIDLYKNQEVLDESALLYYGAALINSLETQPRVPASYVTPEWFSLVQPQMHLGRVFSDDEGIDSHIPVAVISHDMWVEDYSKDTDILGKTITVNGVGFKVVGVVSSDFVEPQLFNVGLDTKIWLTWDFNVSPDFMKTRWTSTNSRQFYVGKIPAGLSSDQVSSELTSYAAPVWSSNVLGVEKYKGAQLKIKLTSFAKVMLGDTSNTLYMLLAGVIGMVIIAFANISNLFLARTAEQQRSIAIRAVFGAKNKDKILYLLSETVILMGLSLILAVAVSLLGFNVFAKHLTDVLPRVNELGVSLSTIAVAVVTLIILTVSFSFLNSRVIDFQRLSVMLSSSGKGTGVQVSSFTRQILMVSQIGAAIAIVAINLILILGSKSAIDRPTYFNLNNVVSLQMAQIGNESLTNEEREEILRRVGAGIKALPEVEEVSQSFSPFDCINCYSSIRYNDDLYKPRSKFVDDKYFSVIEQKVIEGDAFDREHIQNNEKVVLVNDVLANKLSPNSSIVGNTLSGNDGIPHRIIGVVKAIKIPGQLEDVPTTYWPTSKTSTNFTIKLQEGFSLGKLTLFNVIKNEASQFNVYSLDKLNDIRDRMLFNDYVALVSTLLISVLAILIASAGLYGLISYSLEMRRSEIGTRLALGAKKLKIILLILKGNMLPSVVGAVLAFVVIAVVCDRVLFGLDFVEKKSVAISLVATLLIISSMISFSCYWPLRKYINRPVVYSLRGEA